MDKIIDLLRLMKVNYSTDIIYFEKIIHEETGKYVEIFIEDNKIKLYHKVTGSEKCIYIPSERFIELADAFIEANKPTLKYSQIEYIKQIFSKHKVNHSF